jgi:hypothetical protein
MNELVLAKYVWKNGRQAARVWGGPRVELSVKLFRRGISMLPSS